MPTKLEELQKLLDQLADSTQPISTPQLFHLSDLAGERLALFWDTWETLLVTQRCRLANALVELAEASFEVNFDAIFRRLMDDPEAEVRTAAIDGLWENHDVSLTGAFLNRLLHDPAVMVRASAATALGRYVLAGELEQLPAPIETRITTELLTVLHLAGESIEVRRRAIEAVSYSCTPETLQAIEDAYFDEDEKMRISAVLAMGRSCDQRWAKPLLQELESANPAMRFEAAWACGELALKEAVPILAGLIDDADHQVSNAAIWSLGQIGGDRASQALINALEDADQDTQIAIEEALAELELAPLDLLFYDLESGLPQDMDGDLSTLWPDDQDDDGDYDEASIGYDEGWTSP